MIPPVGLLLLMMLATGCHLDKKPQENGVMPQNEKVLPVSELRDRLKEEGFEVFDYVDEKSGDTILMQQYFIAFLKSGPNRSQSRDEADSLQRLHMAHLGRMYEEGYADISGPFGDDGDIRGITIYNTPTLEVADSLAEGEMDRRVTRLEGLAE